MNIGETVVMFLFILAVVGPWVWGGVSMIAGIGVVGRDRQRGLKQIRVGAGAIVAGSLVAEVVRLLVH